MAGVLSGKSRPTMVSVRMKKAPFASCRKPGIAKKKIDERKLTQSLRGSKRGKRKERGEVCVNVNQPEADRLGIKEDYIWEKKRCAAVEDSEQLKSICCLAEKIVHVRAHATWRLISMIPN